MNARFARHGRITSDVEIENVAEEGFRLRIGQERLHMPYPEFPWFRHAPLDHVLNVAMPHADSVRWPHLDIDLAVESIRHPERFPLVYR
jgi:hypothetical protein